jgi:putative redox protein
MSDSSYTATHPVPPPGPVTSRSEITWRGEKLFDAGPPGRTQIIDGNAKVAPGPVETLLGAIAACMSVDVIDILEKRRATVTRYHTKVTADRRPEFPRRVRRLDLEVHVDGTGLDRENTERAISLSFERYCSVGASLASDIVVNAALVLNAETFEPFALKVWQG